MNHEHFNAFYEPYLEALSVKNIYFNQAKYNKLWINILHWTAFLFLISSCIILFFVPQYGVSIAILSMVSILLLISIDTMAVKNCVKTLRNKYQTKFLTITYFEQFKYFLWKEELKDIPNFFSINKALQFLNVELSKFTDENRMSVEYLPILNGITLIAFWHIFDEIHLAKGYQLIVYAIIFYVSYRYATFKFYFSKHRKLREFKQYLLRLKSELINKNLK